MVKVFSFVIYGNEAKYTKGLLANINLITTNYPNWQIWIYYGTDVPNNVLSQYKSYDNVILIPTYTTGPITKCFRYFPIDNNTVELCIIRDADSRIYNRDQLCINEFLLSDKLFHIIRDHPNHNHKIMAGMWGIKKGALNVLIKNLFDNWAKTHSFDFWSDTQFLTDCIYPIVYNMSLIHDDLHRYNEQTKCIPHTLNDKHFIGQVYEYNNDQEYPKFDY